MKKRKTVPAYKKVMAMAGVPELKTYTAGGNGGLIGGMKPSKYYDDIDGKLKDLPAWYNGVNSGLGLGKAIHYRKEKRVMSCGGRTEKPGVPATMPVENKIYKVTEDFTPSGIKSKWEIFANPKISTNPADYACDPYMYQGQKAYKIRKK